MLIGAIGDDFTGAGDLANTLAQAGLSTKLIIDINGPPPKDAQAVVVALKSRTIPADEAVQISLEALAFLQQGGMQQLIFKYCSTFDSTPEGNIGPVAVALADALKARKVIFAPSFPAQGRSVYQGHLFVGDRLLSESPMAEHPLTPMTDSNIRRWLAQQVKEPVGLLPLTHVRGNLVEALGKCRQRLLIADAIEDEDLLKLARVIASEPLVTGGSAIAKGLAANWITPEKAHKPIWNPLSDPAIILAGSCSVMTQTQIETYRATGAPYRPLTVEEALSGSSTLAQEIIDWSLSQESPALIASTDQPAAVREAQNRFGRNACAQAIEHMFGAIAAGLARRGVRRFVIAGGETSGAITQALGVKSLEIGPEIAPGVPLMRSADYALALKSGNFGDKDFFSRSLKMMSGEAK